MVQWYQSNIWLGSLLDSVYGAVEEIKRKKGVEFSFGESYLISCPTGDGIICNPTIFID